MLIEPTEDKIARMIAPYEGSKALENEVVHFITSLPQLTALRNTQSTLNQEPTPSSLLNIKREFINMNGTTTFVLEDGVMIAEGTNECLYGRDYDGRLVTEYSDSGRELSAKQVYDFNIKRNKFTHFWVSGYSARELEKEVLNDPSLGRYSRTTEWEV